MSVLWNLLYMGHKFLCNNTLTSSWMGFKTLAAENSSLTIVSTSHQSLNKILSVTRDTVQTQQQVPYFSRHSWKPFNCDYVVSRTLKSAETLKVEKYFCRQLLGMTEAYLFFFGGGGGSNGM